MQIKDFNFVVNFVFLSEGNNSQTIPMTHLCEKENNSESDWAMGKGTDLTTIMEGGGDKLKLKCLRACGKCKCD